MIANLRCKTPDDDVETPAHVIFKRLTLDHHHYKGQSPPVEHLPKDKRLSHDQYTVGWVCALHIEMAAAMAMLDAIHRSLPQDPKDSNTYTLGRIGDHNVAIASLPAARYGTNNAATVASNMSRSFPSIRAWLMVGIGGGIPGEDKASIRLGDVVVGTNVVQYDLGKIVRGGTFKRTGVPGRPPTSLMTAVNKLRADYETDLSNMPRFLSEMLERHPTMVKYTHPGQQLDQLFESSYEHADDEKSCEFCDTTRLVKDWPLRESCDPRVHYGYVASGNQVMKNADERDRLATSLGIICFEMEAAGLMDSFPCLVIRGISDYSDSHKNKRWQQYAAATAAAYAKELLYVLPIAESLSSLDLESEQKKIENRNRIFELLKFQQLQFRHDNIKAAHATTCEWFFQHPDYKEWLDPKKAIEHYGFLWINGKPGTGKSTLMKFLYTKAKNSCTSGSSAIAFFFNARGSGIEKTSIGMYRSLLFQLLTNLEDLREVLDQLKTGFGTQNKSSIWYIEILQDLFSEAILRLGSRRLTCFIDALDECTEGEVQDMIYYFEHLGRLAAENGIRLLICFSSRHYPCISVLYGKTLVLEDQSGHEQDLRHYVKQAFQRFGAGKMVEEIQLDILSKATGIFMWVVLVVDILTKEIQRGRLFAVKRRLRDIPDKLSDLFKEILTRDNENMDDLLLCIQWILFSRSPLSCDEYYFALASGLSSDINDFGEWNEEYIPRDIMRQYVSSSSKGLAEVTMSGMGTIQFIHESVPDFLIKDNGIRELWPEAGQNFQDFSHEKLKHCCYSYMKGYISMRDTKDSRRKFPFLRYATSNVLYHADLAANSILQYDFLENFPLAAWIRLGQTYTDSASLIYILAEKGLPRLISMLRKISPQVEVLGECYKYPLFAALANGNGSALEALVRPSENDSATSSICARLQYGSYGDDTALRWSLTNGFGPHVLLLIHKDGVELRWKDVNRTDFSFTLRYADQMDVIDIFMEWLMRSTVETRGAEQMMAWASARGSEYIVRMLLDKGAHIESKNILGQTPLMVAAAHAHMSVIRLLLERNADIEARDNSGQTALILAAMTGAFDTVKLLAEHGCDIHNRDNSGRSALNWTESKGNTMISKYLVDKGARR
ncbi:hypothetical protein F4680DRAFT_404664 [Xylaria scruposa]|nr:hypothetical protein F4680DRAFT_404664 [Xylaria scruposa]